MKLKILYIPVIALVTMVTACTKREMVIKGKVINYQGETISLYKVTDGNLDRVETIQLDADSLFQFKIPGYPSGFYYLGSTDEEKSVFVSMYLKAGQQAEILINHRKIDEVTVPNPECLTYQKRWNSIASNLQQTLISDGRDKDKVVAILSNYNEQYQSFLQSINTPDAEFNAFMKLAARVSFETIWIRAFGMSTVEAAAEMSSHPAFKAIGSHSFSSAELLKMNGGARLLGSYPFFIARLTEEQLQDYFEFSINIFSNDTLKGQILKDHIIRRKVSGKDFQKLMERYGHCLVTAKQQSDIKAYEAEIMKFAEGKPAHDFCYIDIHGKKHALSDYKGKVVLVDVWATWCTPCKAQIPHLEKLMAQYEHNAQMVFMSVSIDKDRARWENYIKEHHMKGILLCADKAFKSQIILDYEISGVPRFMLFDQEGKIVSVNTVRPSNPQLKQMIDETLAK